MHSWEPLFRLYWRSHGCGRGGEAGMAVMSAGQQVALRNYFLSVEAMKTLPIRQRLITLISWASAQRG